MSVTDLPPSRRTMVSPAPEPSPPGDDLAALYKLIQAGGFWRLAPDWVPRTYAEPTKELADRVRHGLRRLGG
ncbi:hypothetical protein ACFU99_11055 [Streptomyces sp. NPDC057654]|uniref:hypothetical protein n=1 Tax=Streptomyces sp. NPDC057654 TaxID=3346196 RepID=UPI00369C0D10